MLTDEIRALVETHISGQPYDIRCAKCGEKLSFDLTVDSALDMMLKVNPCNVCVVDEYNKGYSDGVQE